jgi:peptide chain release factor 2
MPRSWIGSPTSPRASASCGGIFDYDQHKEHLDELDAQAADPEFWNDAAHAQLVVREQGTIKKLLETIDAATNALAEGRDLYELAREEGDDDSVLEAWAQLGKAEEIAAQLEFRRMLSGPNDAKSAIISINAGAGGVDSQDWAEMLFRMYCRFGERMGLHVKVLDVQEGEQAGIRSAEIEIEGEYAYGHLRSEIGVHRLVRISPFDAAARRQTSFVSVMIMPDLSDEEIQVEIRDVDLREDTYRASGKGGQHVNKTDSAVRLTHLPTGIVVACQAERSQHKNRDTAMRMLKTKLWAVEEEKRQAKVDALQGEKKAIEWGSQIRSYVLQPYQQVNDHRTGLKVGNVNAVLDGDLQGFIEAFLLAKGKAGAPMAEEDENLR